MLQDIKALELLRKELTKLYGLPDPPKDLNKTDDFENTWSLQLDKTQKLVDDIAAYARAIHEQMEELRIFFNRSTKKVQMRIKEIVDSIEWTSNQSKTFSLKPLRVIQMLQNLEQKKSRLEKSVIETQLILDKIEETSELIPEDIDNLKGCIRTWMEVRDKSCAEEKSRKEAEEKAEKEREEAIKKNEQERKRLEKEERRRQEEERRRKEEERKLQEEEKRRKEEEERKRKEEERRRHEEERRRKEEERKLQEEEKRRKEEEERKRKEKERRRQEEERRRKEEERKLQEEEKRRKEEEERKRKEEERKKQEKERRRKKEEERKRKEEERRMKEEEERKRQEEERRRQEEERRRKEEEERKRQEEERKRKEEKVRIRQEEEERKRQEEEKRRKEEEERKRLEDEERIRKETEEKRKREEEEERRRQEEIRIVEEEERRKKKEREKFEEERRRRKEEERREMERRRRDEEERKRRLDPNNWVNIRYPKSDGEVDGARKGLCCVVSAVQDSLKEEDLECLASDEDRSGEITGVAGDIPASSVVHVTSKTGRKDLEAPMRVFVPCSQVDSDDEIVIRDSVDGRDWQERTPIYQPGLLKDIKNHSLVATEINQFEEAKIIVVARTKSEDIIVDKPGLVHQSSIDKNVKFIFPRDTFKHPTRVKIQIRQIQPERLNLAIQQYKYCHFILSTSPVVTVTSDDLTNRDVDIDIIRASASDTRLENGRYHHVYRGKDKQWHFAGSGVKDHNQDVTITLPSGKKHFSVLEIETLKEARKESVLLAAENIFNYAHKSVVRFIARQKIDNPSMMMLHCVRRDQVDSRLAELDSLGYSIGPDTSREFCLSDGQTLQVQCKGNIGMTTRSKKSVVSLMFRVYMDSAKQEVSLFVVDENKQRDNETYLGLLLFEAIDTDRQGTSGHLPITMPKVHQPKPRTARARIRFQPHLSALCRYLGWRLTQDDDESWLDILRFLGPERNLNAIYRRAKTQYEDDDKRKICQTVFENWMKSLPMEVDKVQLILEALEISGYKELASDCNRFVKVHKVLFSERVVSHISDSMTGDVAFLNAKLQLSEEEREQLQSQEKCVKIYNTWSKWQLSDDIICRGEEAAQYCLQTIESVLGKENIIQDLKLALEQAGVIE